MQRRFSVCGGIAENLQGSAYVYVIVARLHQFAQRAAVHSNLPDWNVTTFLFWQHKDRSVVVSTSPMECCITKHTTRTSTDQCGLHASNSSSPCFCLDAKVLPGTAGAIALVVPIAHVACRPDSVCPVLIRCHEKVLRSLDWKRRSVSGWMSSSSTCLSRPSVVHRHQEVAPSSWHVGMYDLSCLDTSAHSWRLLAGRLPSRPHSFDAWWQKKRDLQVPFFRPSWSSHVSSTMRKICPLRHREHVTWALPGASSTRYCIFDLRVTAVWSVPCLKGSRWVPSFFLFERICLEIYPRLPGEFHSMLWDSDDGRVMMVISHSRLGWIEAICSLLSCPDVRSARVDMRIAKALAAWGPDSMWHSR